jgi:hypothetical protein
LLWQNKKPFKIKGLYQHSAFKPYATFGLAEHVRVAYSEKSMLRGPAA